MSSRMSFKIVNGVKLFVICNMTIAADVQKYIELDSFPTMLARFKHGDWFRAIYIGEGPIGFVMLKAIPQYDEYFVWIDIFDRRFRNEKCGLGMMGEIIDYVHETYPTADTITVTYPIRKGWQEAFYRRLGFEPTGEMRGEECIACLTPLRVMQ